MPSPTPLLKVLKKIATSTDKLKGASRPAIGRDKLTALQTGINKAIARDAHIVVPAKVKAATGVRFQGKSRQMTGKQIPAKRLQALDALVRTSNKKLSATQARKKR